MSKQELTAKPMSTTQLMLSLCSLCHLLITLEEVFSFQYFVLDSSTMHAATIGVASHELTECPEKQF